MTMPFGRIVVGTVDIEVVHRTLVGVVDDVVDDGFLDSFGSLHEHGHSPTDVRQRDDVVDLGGDSHPAIQSKPTRRRNGSRQVERVAVVGPEEFEEERARALAVPYGQSLLPHGRGQLRLGSRTIGSDGHRHAERPRTS